MNYYNIKKFTVKIIFIVLFIIFFYSGISNADASEKIYNYTSEIYINEDNSMIVEETIEVYANGDSIKRGIYRNFPIKYVDKNGNDFIVGFELVEVLKNGKSEPYKIEEKEDKIRIIIGDANTLLEPAKYTYTIKYKTDKQLGLFDDHNELYWNVTGNGWSLKIDKATAIVHLPDGLNMTEVRFDAFTGKKGSTEKYFNGTQNDNGTITLYTTKVLDIEEGFTIVVAFPNKKMETEDMIIKEEDFADILNAKKENILENNFKNLLIIITVSVIVAITLILILRKKNNTGNLSKYEKLQNLQRLKEDGIISETEFEIEKAKLLK